MPTAKKAPAKKAQAKKTAAKKATAKKSSAKKTAAKKATAKKTAARKSSAATPKFSAEERAAMRDYVKEKAVVAHRKGKADSAADLAEVKAKIAKMAPADRALAERVHAIVTSTAPELAPRTWYGMPAYAKDGSVLCYFQDAAKFKSRYAILGFSDKAALDEDRVWPVVWALSEITAADEAAIRALVRRAVG